MGPQTAFTVLDPWEDLFYIQVKLPIRIKKGISPAFILRAEKVAGIPSKSAEVGPIVRLLPLQKPTGPGIRCPSYRSPVGVDRERAV